MKFKRENNEKEEGERQREKIGLIKERKNKMWI
jgi:hypothetical protein